MTAKEVDLAELTSGHASLQCLSLSTNSEKESRQQDITSALHPLSSSFSSTFNLVLH